MLHLYKLVLSLHIAAGLTGLAAFWTPAFARKGGTTHVQHSDGENRQIY